MVVEIQTTPAELQTHTGSKSAFVVGTPVITDPARLLPAAISHRDKKKNEGFLEKEQMKTSRLLIIQDREYPQFIEELRKEGVVPTGEEIEDGNVLPVDYKKGSTATIYLPQGSRNGVLKKMELANAKDSDTHNFFRTFETPPETVIVHIPSRDSLRTNEYAYRELWLDWFRLPPGNRPRIIAYTPGFSPMLFQRHDYQGFLFCSSSDELRDVLELSNALAQEQARRLYNPQVLTSAQMDAYDNSNLREWDNRTADTYQSLKLILQRFHLRNALYLKGDLEEELFTPQRSISTILDIGTGERRIAQMLARLGLKVMGLDISRTQLERGRIRIKEEGEGLRGEKEHPGLSYQALLKLQREGILSREPIWDDEETARNYLSVQGSFFDLHRVLNQALIEWDKRFPGINIRDFFNRYRYRNAAFSIKWDMFLDAGFDAAIVNWNTFCEFGSPENQKDILEQILNVLSIGGELMIEISDRTREPISSALQKYYAEHPDEPYGTIRDPKPPGFEGLQGEELYPPRYFPDINELLLLLKSLGYEVDPKSDVKKYLIEDEGISTSEYFITARKAEI